MGQNWAFCGPLEERLGPSWCVLNLGASSMVTTTTTRTTAQRTERRRRRPRRRKGGGSAGQDFESLWR
eukprot:9477461-Pyramimonas_sp.AAC.1